MWDEKLPYVQHAYNHVMHSSTKKKPFEIYLGYLTKSPLDFDFGEESEVNGHNDVDKEKRFIQKIQQVHKAIHEQLEKSQATYKERHNRNWVDHQF